MSPVTRGWIRFAVSATLAVFTLITLDVTLDRVLKGKSFDRLDSAATTNAFLRVLDAPNPAMLVEGGLRRYPADKTLLLVGPSKESFFSQLYYTIAYLAYPRPVSAMICGEPGKTAPTAIEKVPPSAPIDGVIFFETDPGPWAAGGTWITPKLYIAPHTGPAQWESFCR